MFKYDKITIFLNQKLLFILFDILIFIQHQLALVVLVESEVNELTYVMCNVCYCQCG